MVGRGNKFPSTSVLSVLSRHKTSVLSVLASFVRHGLPRTEEAEAPTGRFRFLPSSWTRLAIL